MPLTFGALFPGATRQGAREESSPAWRIGGSGVSGPPDDAPITKAVLAFLTASRIEIRRVCLASPICADMYTWEGEFLDGGFVAQTGPYFGGEKFAQVSGPRAALFVALGLGLRVPNAFLVRHRLEHVSLDELNAER